MSLLHLENVSLKPILKQINYRIEKDDFVILLGSNGSGKSTLLKLLHRQHTLDDGQIHFMGSPLVEHEAQDFSKNVSFLTQNCADSLFTSLTVYENFLLIKRDRATSACRNEQKQFQDYLLDFNPNLAKKLNAPITQLSGGEKQALTLALCLLHPPALLLLDEHTSALDPKTSEQIMQLTQTKIIEHNITCILTTHDLDIALRYGNRILMLHEGEVKKMFDREDKRTASKEMLVGHYY